ncbi:MAG TPA: response regulator transcription factor [Opitutales bacterium]|jgi:DNA-binding NarL/FixJ family response regulator|nr:response regulator transcription factor [Opitutales bacterium]
MKIVVIDDHVLMREMLLRICQEVVPGASVSGAGDAQSGLALCQVKQPKLIILDFELPDRDGLDVLEELLALSPHSRVIGLSGYSDEFTLHRVFHSKLHGFVDKKEQTIGQLTVAIQSVMSGVRYFSPRVNTTLLSQRNDAVAFHKILSEREQQLLRLFGRGLSNEEIAAELHLSELTVRNHRCRTMAKLGLRTSAELIRYALEKGFTRVEPQDRNKIKESAKT